MNGQCRYQWEDQLFDADDRRHSCIAPAGHDDDEDTSGWPQFHVCGCGATANHEDGQW
jgi:hypothetical protein